MRDKKNKFQERNTQQMRRKESNMHNSVNQKPLRRTKEKENNSIQINEEKPNKIT
jgi:hypothetical protein